MKKIFNFIKQQWLGSIIILGGLCMSCAISTKENNQVNSVDSPIKFISSKGPLTLYDIYGHKILVASSGNVNGGISVIKLD